MSSTASGEDDDPDDTTDVEHEEAVSAWKSETTAFDRVYSVAVTIDRPQAVAYIADEAHVAENTARNHLQRLVKMSVLQEITDAGTTFYAPNPLHTRLKTLQELIDEHTHDELIDLKADLQERIDAWKDEYGVETPTKLREQAATETKTSNLRKIKKTASNWEHAEYRLTAVETAIQHYDIYTREQSLTRRVPEERRDIATPPSE